MQKAVVFDMDGVILDSERLSLAAWRELAPEYGLDGIEEVFAEAMGHSVEELCAMFREKYGRDLYPEFQERTNRWILQNTPGGVIPLREGTRELLEYLRRNDVRIGLATATDLQTVERELGAVGALDFFDTIVAGDMVRHCKPDPELFLTACERLGVKPKETYGVEDGRNGILALHAAGMKAILAEDQYHPEPEIAALCKAVIPSMCEVQDYFKEL